MLARMIRGKRIVLVPARPNNAQEIVVYYERYPRGARNFAFFALDLLTVEKERKYLRRTQRSPNDIVFIIRTHDGEFVGTCGLHDIDWRNGNARLGIILFNEEMRGRGYGKEALANLINWAFSGLHYGIDGEERCGLHKLYLNVFSGNEVGQHLYVSIGLRWEARLRSEYRIGGEYQDLFRMSLLREEWEKGKEWASDRKTTP